MTARKLHQALRWICMGAAIAWLTGCATQPPKDYSAYRAADPKSILVVPPLNESPEVQATASVLSHTTMPLAEAGYYVLPVTLVTETFRHNGLETAGDIHQLPYNKLHEIFGADAALYITITDYGVSYKVIKSEARVTAQAQLVDLHTGTELWTGSATASNQEGKRNDNLAVMLIGALVDQVVGSLTDASHPVAGLTTQRLLTPTPFKPDGILYGPRSPLYRK